MNLNLDEILSKMPKLSRSIEKYIWIEKAIHQPDFFKNKEFQKHYNGFYRVRQRSQNWYQAYYDLLGEQASKQFTYKEVLLRLYEIDNKLEVSFSSKLIATIDPNQPIWDQYVLENLGLLKGWKKSAKMPLEERIEYAARLYGEAQKWYEAFISSEEGKRCIAMFDRAFPNYRDDLTSLKKIDFLLWSNRSPKE